MLDRGRDAYFLLPLNLSAVSKNFIFTPGKFVRTYIFDILSNFQTHHSLEKKKKNRKFVLSVSGHIFTVNATRRQC